MRGGGDGNRPRSPSVAWVSGGRYVGGMERVLVYHNPVCSKSRGALDILREHGVDCDVVEYLRSPLDRATLERVLEMLGGPPSALVRHDKRFAELRLRAEDYVTREQVVALLLEHPELMERPVVIRDGRAVIARPSEKVAELLD
jgi:arsenate reductase